MRVVVIGGTNFIGPHVVTTLNRLGHEITVYHRGVHEPELPLGVRHVHSPHAGIPVHYFPAELSDSSPDVVLHMFPVGEHDTSAAAGRFAGVARRMVVLSSGDVYRAYGRLLGTEAGPIESVPLDEDAPLRETFFPYRHSTTAPAEWTFHYEKILAERAVMRHPSLQGTVLRLPAVYGPGDPSRRLRPYIRRMDDHRRAVLLEETQAGSRWTHGYVENVADAIALAVCDDHAAGKIYNLGESETPTVAERVHQIAEIAGWSGEVRAVKAERLPLYLRAPYQRRQDLVMDTGRIRRELGWIETHSTGEGIRRTIEWERENPPAVGDPGPTEYAAEDAVLQ